MPIPDAPYTRKESYLNAIATGNASGIPETPYTREEMYLDAIVKGGGGGGGGGSSTLSGLTDVDITNPTDGQVLVYNATSGKWENGAASGGSRVLVLSVNSVTQYTPETTDDPERWEGILDITTGELIAAFNSNTATPVFVHIPTFGHDTTFTYETQENFCPMLHVTDPTIELSDPAMERMMPPLAYFTIDFDKQAPNDPVHFYAAATSIH